MIRAHRSLILVHLVANALLLWLAYEWLGVDESTSGKLVLSAVDALAILTLSCWLYGATFVCLHSEKPRLNEAFRAALRRVGALLALAIAALVIYGLLAKAATSLGTPALKLASWITWTIRKPVKPATITAFVQAIFWLFRWAVLPIVLLPVAAALATEGRPRWRFHRRHLAIPVFALAGLWLPLVILNWKLKAPTFPLEMTSFVVRAIVAYLLFIASILAMARTSLAVRSAPIPLPPADHTAAPIPQP